MRNTIILAFVAITLTSIVAPANAYIIERDHRHSGERDHRHEWNGRDHRHERGHGRIHFF
jgi:hypothetical protein